MTDQTEEITAKPFLPASKPYPSLGQAFALIGILVLVSIIVSIPLIILQKTVLYGMQSITNLLIYSISMASLLVIGTKFRKSAKFEWKQVTWKILVLIIPLVISLGMLMEPILEAIPMPDLVKEYFNSMFTNDFYGFVLVAVIAPLLEELIFRGIILDGFLKRFFPIKAIFWSAIIFGLAHLNPWQFPAAFLFGLVIGWMYWKTGSLIPGIAAHFVANSSSFLLMWLTGDSFITVKQLVGNNNLYFILYGMCIPVFVGTVFFILREFRPETEKA